MDLSVSRPSTPQERLFEAFKVRAITSSQLPATLLALIDAHLAATHGSSIALNTSRDLLRLPDADATAALEWLDARS